MKKTLILLLASTMALTVLCGCTGKESPAAKDPYKITERSEDFSYYTETKMNAEKKLYVFGREGERSLNTHELIVGSAVQGLYARDEVTFYLNTGENAYTYWLNDMAETYGVTAENVTLEQMVGKYRENFGDNAGYILYDAVKNQPSVNVATTICGITGYLPVDKSLQSTVQGWGLAQKLDVSERTQKWCFDTYKDQLNNDSLVQQSPQHAHLRDYSIMNRYLCFYEPGATSAAIKYRGEVHSWAKKDAPIFGWGPGTEDSHVGIASNSGQFTIPSDFCFNTTVFSARGFFGNRNIKQPNANAKIKADYTKHYVSFIRSDGDNIQTWYNYFPFSEKDMGAVRGNFPMGWSIQPSLTDIAPNIIKNVYENADKNDYFVAAVSGFGYFYPKQYPRLADYMGSLELYLKRADVSIVQILDSGPYDDVIEYYSRVPSLKGGVYMYGDKYSGGRGSIYWSENGKPFISFRESLWNQTAAGMAQVINSYPAKNDDITGYSLINLHPWSCTYGDVINVVSLLGPNVEVVSPGQLFDLVIENVPKNNRVLS